MDVKNKLRNNLISRIQRLSMDKLTELSGLLAKVESQMKSKDRTLQLAGTWKDLDNDILTDLTERLHENRGNDRKIN